MKISIIQLYGISQTFHASKAERVGAAAYSRIGNALLDNRERLTLFENFRNAFIKELSDGGWQVPEEKMPEFQSVLQEHGDRTVEVDIQPSDLDALNQAQKSQPENGEAAAEH